MPEPLTDEELGAVRRLASNVASTGGVSGRSITFETVLRLLDEHKALRETVIEVKMQALEHVRKADERVAGVELHLYQNREAQATAARRLELLRECRRPDRVCPVCLCVDCDDECRLMKELS
jgi:DNA repair exonuclease SbcCD ATPase subunit